MGGFYELTPEFISTYAPDIQAVDWKMPGNRPKSTEKFIWSPCYKNEYASGGNLLVRGDLMEKYGYEDITSREELEAFLDDVCTGEASVSALGTGGGEFQDLYEWLTLGYSAINGDDNKLFMYHYAILRIWKYAIFWTGMSFPIIVIKCRRCTRRATGQQIR